MAVLAAIALAVDLLPPVVLVLVHALSLPLPLPLLLDTANWTGQASNTSAAAALRRTVARTLTLITTADFQTVWTGVYCVSMFVAATSSIFVQRGSAGAHAGAHAGAYASTLALTLASGVCWLGAHHYALAFPTAVLLSPAVALAAHCAVRTGVLPCARPGVDGSLSHSVSHPVSRTVTRTVSRTLCSLVLAAGAVCASPPAVLRALHSARTALCPSQGHALSADFCPQEGGWLDGSVSGWVQVHGGSLALPVAVLASHAVGCLCGRLLAWSLVGAFASQ